jgi:hypothetical protein
MASVPAIFSSENAATVRCFDKPLTRLLILSHLQKTCQNPTTKLRTTHSKTAYFTLRFGVYAEGVFSARSHPLSELPDGSLVYGVREGGTITFLKNGKVAVGVGGLTYFRQRKRALSRSTLDPNLVDWLEDMLFGQPDNSLGSKILECLVDIPDHVERDKALEVLSRALQALGTLRSGRYTTPVGGKFIDAICELASDLERPPTKMELTHFLIWGTSRHFPPVQVSRF